LTPVPERQLYVEWIKEAIGSGARQRLACGEAGLTARTYQRWTQDGEMAADARTTIIKEPANKLSDIEREAILEICVSEAYASLPPSQIVPQLADTGVYLASESTMYRVLKAAGQLNRRGRARKPRRVALPTSHQASGPNQVWSWDITYLPSPVKGQYWYLYLFEDIYSRKAVGWEVCAQESGEDAAVVLSRCVLSEQCYRAPLVLHSDNGSPMKSSTLLMKMYDLGITPSRGRPRVSNDNPYSESLFRTLKYCPQWPAKGFATLEAAQTWVCAFVRWYNHDHRHSRIRFVTPAQRHEGKDTAILARRHEVYEAAKALNPGRWSGRTRNWTPIGAVMLNPDRVILTMPKAA
jgi:putative transposase